MFEPVQWDYPLFVVAHGGGYVSIVDPSDEDDEQPRQILATHSSEVAALAFMQQFAIVGEPRQLNNDREFRWFLKSLKHPVTKLAFDPQPVELDLNARWIMPIDQFLADYLVVDNSPWHYPVFVIDHGDGFGSIEGRNEEGEPVTLLSIFTGEQTAENFLKRQPRGGTVLKLHNMPHVRELLVGLQDEIAAVAIDPLLDEDTTTSQYCLGVDALLNKYLTLDA